MSAAVYGPFYKHLTSITDGPIGLQHASLNPHPPSNAVANSAGPVTEVLIAYLESKDESYAERSKKFASTIESNGACKGTSTGWILEDAEYQGEKGSAYVLLISWESKEKHLAFRETSTFKESISLIREGTKGLSVHHATFEAK